MGISHEFQQTKGREIRDHERRDGACEDRPTSPTSPSMSEEEIDYNLMGSFPASDPPSWTLGLRLTKKFVTEFDGEKDSDVEPSHQNKPAAGNRTREETAEG